MIDTLIEAAVLTLIRSLVVIQNLRVPAHATGTKKLVAWVCANCVDDASASP